MRKFLKRTVSAALIVLMIAATFSLTLLSVYANEHKLSEDADNASDTVDRLMAGIDISGWQTSVNWTNVKNAGVEFAMFRLTSYSSATHSYTKDSMLDSHINGAKSQGIHIGAYFFSYAKSLDEVRNEANMVMGILKQYPKTFDFPIVFDAESANIQGFAADACVVFREILEANGYYVMIYANNNWFNNIITPASKIASCSLWQAYYPWTTPSSGVEKYEGYTPAQAKSIDFSSRKALNSNNHNVYMWQITQKGTVNGIGGNVDIDICIRDYSQIIPAGGFNDFHTHSYQAGNDTTHHYQICECGDKQSIVEHSYTAQYKNETQHDMKCSCQYIKETVNHTFEYVVDENTHKLVCACGYVKPDSEARHIYDIITPEGARHSYSCVCGVKSDDAGEAHSYAVNSDETYHFDACRKCGFVNIESKTKHEFFMQKSDGDTHWRECICGQKTEAEAHTSMTEKCTECGYHYHEPLFNAKEHWTVCESCSLKTRAELHWFDKDGNCKQCGYKKEMTCEHATLTNGTCAECGYHEHPYAYDENGHKFECSCPQITDTLEAHTFDEGEKCTVCGYEVKAGASNLDGSPETDENTEKDTHKADDGKSDKREREEVGCESALGATAVVGCVAILGCALVFRKKEDN